MSMAARKQQNKEWSLAAAARAARDARIAAVRYMREAAIEREWHAVTLAYGHRTRVAQSDNPDQAPRHGLRQHGLPASLPGELGPGQRDDAGRRGPVPGRR